MGGSLSAEVPDVPPWRIAMSDDNKYSEPFDNELDTEQFMVDFDLDGQFSDAPEENVPKINDVPEDSAFDLENPFGDDLIGLSETSSPPSEDSAAESPFDMGDIFADGMSASDSGVSTGNPYLGDSADDSPNEESKTSDGEEEPKKKGFLGGIFGGKGKKEKAKKKSRKKEEEQEESEDDIPEEKPRKRKPKKEKIVKEKKPAGERKPLDVGAILCIVFSVCLLASLLLFNVAAFLSREPGGSMMQTLCFMGAINLIGLAAASVPVLFYQFPQWRTLPNVMLGISAVAMLSTVMVAVTEFYRYGFMLSP